MEEIKESDKNKQEGEIEIVPLQEKHVAALAALEKEIFSDPWSEQTFRNLLTYPYCHYLVAELGGEPVGLAGMSVLVDEGDIDNVLVAPDWRRRGIADRLLGELFQEGARLGVQAYTLEVRTGNAAAIRLYEKNGFVGEGVRPGYYEKPREDALIMWKR